ncbi:methyltransferase domain-containing protein [Salinispora arenicola]|uniref:methyltransferase domain-containing protein n=1 Tax=Salinispora arenicola TaxID=168697 RepID=UPI0016AAB4D0|nr:methyltransferase domain-containing protein [Salinispora arenicola]NIL57126.1 methyltransferase domain-containing protein [Salinispora arenicola]
MTDPTAGPRHELAAKLTTAGALQSPAWVSAFEQVSRHLFAPTCWHRTATGLEHLDSTTPEQRDHWLAVCYSDVPLVTQVDSSGTATSASSQPSVMAIMLEALDVTTGTTVLEVGTGTGYNAALLCHRLGDDRVHTVEYDQALSTTAAAALAQAGYHPAMRVGDGAEGWPEQGPYDRIIATYGTERIPPTWLRQCTPGGVIVANLGLGVIALHVDQHGHTASGRFLSRAAFMLSRADPAAAMIPDAAFDPGVLCDGSPADAPPDLRADSFVAWLHLRYPGIAQITIPGPNGTGDQAEHIYANRMGSWARVGHGQVIQVGPVWRDVHNAHTRWVRAGRPEVEQLGLTVRDDGHHTLWVDNPSSTQRWNLTP